MKAIDNSNLVNYNGSQPSLVPAVSYVYDAAAKTVVVTDGTTGFASGDALKKVHVKVSDKFGGEVRDAITATGGGGAKTIDVSSLDASKGLDVRATVLTNKLVAADGGAYNIGAAGSVANWDKQQNA